MYFISAQVNLATCRVTAAGTLAIHAALLVRIFFGPFGYLGVVAFHYAARIVFCSFLTMITFNRVLKAFFIYDFHRLSLIPEHKVMSVFGGVTALISVICFVQEWVLRHVRGLEHYGRGDAYFYLGKVV